MGQKKLGLILIYILDQSSNLEINTKKEEKNQEKKKGKEEKEKKFDYMVEHIDKFSWPCQGSQIYKFTSRV